MKQFRRPRPVKSVPSSLPTELQPRPRSIPGKNYPRSTEQTPIYRNNPTQERKLNKRSPASPPTLKKPLFQMHQETFMLRKSRKRTSPNGEYNDEVKKKKDSEELCAGDQQAIQKIDSLSLQNDNAIGVHALQKKKNSAGRLRQKQQISRKLDTKHRNPDIQTVARVAVGYLNNVPEEGRFSDLTPLKRNHASLQQSQGLSNVTGILSPDPKKILERIHPIADKRESIGKQHHDYHGKLKPADSEPRGMTTFPLARSSPRPSSYSDCYSMNKKTDQHGLCGLVNIGNICFMNSALQCMSNTEPLRKYFLPSADGSTPKYKKDINKKNPLGMGGAIAEAFGKLLEVMWNGSCTYTSPHELKAEISRFAPRFADFHQQDSQELMAFLLDGLHEDLNRVTVKSYDDVDLTTVDSKDMSDKDLAEKSWKNHLLRNNSRIVDIFQGQLMATVTCHCGNVSRVCDPFMFLALPIPKKMSRYRHEYEWDPNSGLKTINMTNCIELMMDNTILDSWYCTKCKMFVKASRIVNIMRLPEVLIIYFKRFSCSGPYRRDKVTTMVNFPISDLNLSKYAKCDGSTTYDLFAVSNHHGGIWGGHYTTYAKDSSNTWCKFNDSDVSVINEMDVEVTVVSDAAYVLFYRKTRSGTLV